MLRTVRAVPLQSFVPLQLSECFLATFLPLFLQSPDILIYRLARDSKNVGEICGGQERIVEVQPSGVFPCRSSIVPRFPVLACFHVFTFC